MADDTTPLLNTRTLRSASDLAEAGLIDAEATADIAGVGARYAIAITPEVVSLIDPADAADPVARQFVPDMRELQIAPNELADPIGDETHSPVKGVVHRYPDRVLLKLLSVCPVYCRFCFRREMVGPGAEQMLSAEESEAALSYIAGDSNIWEVILTGGDPLMLSPRRLREVFSALDRIGHVKVVRIHTRVPVVDPARISDPLLAALKATGKTVFVALHANHPREFSQAARDACAKIVDAGIPMVSQTVLLKGVNDSAEILAQLMRRFVENRIKPYYLHHADLAPGTSHFRTSLEAGQEIMRQLRGRLSGLAMPTYVLDIPGGYGKSPAGPDYVDMQSCGRASVADWQGNRHSYSASGDDPARKDEHET